MRLDGVARGHRDVVENAEPHRPRPARVVARRAHGAERRLCFFLQHEIGGEHRRPGRAQRRIERMRIHGGVRIEMHRAILRRRLADRAHVFRRMDAGELLVGGERRVVAFQVLRDAGGDQLIIDGRQPRGTLRMVGAHVVPEAIGMRHEGGPHDGHHIPSATIVACS